MADRTQAVGGETGIGDLLVKIRGRHYLIPAEAIGSPLEDGGTEILGMLEKELTALSAARDSRLIGVDFAMELGEGEEDRNSRAIDARQSRSLAKQARSLNREARSLDRQARSLDRQARSLDRQSRSLGVDRSARSLDRQSRSLGVDRSAPAIRL
ncbi:MAG TPA: hypothetical protein VFS85_08135 [Dongiaceae bacterium]|jgi:hypothetical protein|nr:hypothetical protein [Dongiaceae bacterium]